MSSRGHTLTCSGFTYRSPPIGLTSCHRQGLFARRLVRKLGCIPKKGGNGESTSTTLTSMMLALKQLFPPTDRPNSGLHRRTQDAVFSGCFFEYHQIPMHPPDEEKTVFITLHRLYCYKVMPFDSKTLGPFTND
ncbi:hypothetical protein CK203_098994 [Vitis vinifera]|uniref:Uncharacterized protein n=1 Tax=Vitis vinifera TaxID=29760 RepID=A0A438CHG9_VITVI|nr:hypothetical protein CK203_098994 [Vitis vinifera]